MEYLTLEKKLELEKELDHLITVRRKEVADMLNYAKSLGDLSENAEYHQAREDQAYCEDRINEIETVLKNAVIVDVATDGVVHVGTEVTVKRTDTKAVCTFTLVGSTESSVEENRISHESPLGKAVLGRKAGDKVMVEAPKGTFEYTITKIGQ